MFQDYQYEENKKFPADKFSNKKKKAKEKIYLKTLILFIYLFLIKKFYTFF